MREGKGKVVWVIVPGKYSYLYLPTLSFSKFFFNNIYIIIVFNLKFKIIIWKLQTHTSPSLLYILFPFFAQSSTSLSSSSNQTTNSLKYILYQISISTSFYQSSWSNWSAAFLVLPIPLSTVFSAPTLPPPPPPPNFAVLESSVPAPSRKATFPFTSAKRWNASSSALNS